MPFSYLLPRILIEGSGQGLSRGLYFTMQTGLYKIDITSENRFSFTKVEKVPISEHVYLASWEGEIKIHNTHNVKINCQPITIIKDASMITFEMGLSIMYVRDLNTMELISVGTVPAGVALKTN